MFPDPQDDPQQDLRRRYPWPPPVPPPVSEAAPVAGPPGIIPGALDPSKGPTMAAVPPPPVGPSAPLGNPSVSSDSPGPGPMPSPLPPQAPPSVMTGPTPDPVTQVMARQNAPPPPAAPPPVKTPEPPKPGPQELAYRAMQQAGPKRSVLGTIGAAALGAAAGYSNAAGRARPIEIDKQKMRHMTLRNPATGGAWDASMARQRDLAGQESADEAKDRAWQTQQATVAHTQAQTELARQQGAYYDAHGQAVQQEATTRNNAERDRINNQNMDRDLKIGQAGGRVLRPGEPPPPDTYVFKDSAGRTISVPSKASLDQEAITIEAAKAHDIVPNEEEIASGRVFVDRRLWGRLKASDGTSASAAAKRKDDETKQVEHTREFNASLDERKANTELTRRKIQESDDAKAQGTRDREQASIEKFQKDEQDQHALRRGYGQALSAKDGATVVDPRSGAQVAMSPAIRAAYQQRLETATEQATRAHEAQRKLIGRGGGDPGQPLDMGPAAVKTTAPPPATAPPPVPGVGLGGRGRPQAATPPSARRVTNRAAVEAFATENKMTYEQAKQIAEKENYTVQ